jgi:hypothetical protein
MDKKEVIPIVFCTADNYFPFMAVAMNSIIQNLSIDMGGGGASQRIE